MNRISGFRITKLIVHGIKCFQDRVEFDFGDFTYITAGNGQGKSTIADAISWAFAGTPFFGDSRGLDRLQNPNMDGMEVNVEFIDDKGVMHTLIRNRKNDNTVIIYDGFNVRQTDMNAVFGSKEEFLSIFNPLYLIDVLAENGKNLLENLLPVIDHKTVLASLSASSRELLENEHISSPEVYIKNRRNEIREIEETVVKYRGKQELMEEQALNLNGLQITLDRINIEISQLEEIRDKDRNTEAEERLLSELTERRNNLLAGTDNNYDRESQSLINEIRKVESSIIKQEAQQYVPQYTAQISEKNSELNILYAEHKKLSDAFNNVVVGYKCPTCRSEITDKNANDIKSDLKIKLENVVKEGKEKNLAVHRLAAQETSAKDEFEKTKFSELEVQRKELAKLNLQLDECNIAREVELHNYKETLESLNEEITAMERQKSNGNLTMEQVHKLSELQRSKSSCQSKIDTLSSVAVEYDIKEQIATAEKEITRLKVLVNEAENYAAKRTELMLKELRMDRAEIALYDIVKSTGEIKDCFRFTYDGKNYKWLSLSEKIKAGVEVSQLIKRLSDRNYPIFIDNCESICTFDGISRSGQMIAAKAIKGVNLKVFHSAEINAA